MPDPIDIVRIVRTCYAYPAQWDAWDDEGRYYYVRYRHGYFTVNADDIDGPLIAEHTDDTGGGRMEWDDVERLSPLRLVEALDA